MIDQRAHAVNLAVIAAGASSRSLVLPGPEALVVFGVSIPIFSALAGAIGVGLGQLIAPAGQPMTLRRRLAVVAAMLLLTLTIVIASGQWPLVALAWGIGLGFSGPTVAETLGAQAVAGAKQLTDAFFSAIAARMNGNKDKTDA